MSTVVSRRSSRNKPPELGASLLVELRLFWLLCFLQQMGINVTPHRPHSYVYGNPRGLHYDESRLQHRVSKPLHVDEKTLSGDVPIQVSHGQHDSTVGEKSVVVILCRTIFRSVWYEIFLFSAGTAQYRHLRSRLTIAVLKLRSTVLLCDGERSCSGGKNGERKQKEDGQVKGRG